MLLWPQFLVAKSEVEGEKKQKQKETKNSETVEMWTEDKETTVLIHESPITRETPWELVKCSFQTAI